MSEQVLSSDGRTRDGGGIAPQGAVFGAYMNGTNQSVIQWGTVIFNTKLFDPYNWYDTSTGRFTPKIQGYYRITFRVRDSAPPSGGWSRAQLARNGNSYADGDFQQGTMPGGSSGSAIVYLNGTTDYASVLYSNSDGTTHTILGGGDSEHSNFFGELIGATTPLIPKPSQFISVANYLPGGLPINGSFTIPQGGDGNYWFMGWGSSYTNTAGSLGAIGFGIDTASTQGQSKMYFQNSGFHIPFPPCFWRVANLGAGSHTFNIHNDQFCTPDSSDFFSIFAMRE